jgi:hypothetical protein
MSNKLNLLVEEVAAERELTELVSIVNESENLNEGVMGNIGYKLMSFSLGILPEDHVDKIFNKVLTELPKDLSSQIKKKNPGRKEKVEALRAGLKKVITDKKGSELVNKSAKQLSSKIKSDLKKDPSLKEETSTYEIEAIKQGVNSTSKGILRMIYSSIVSSIIGLIGQVFFTLGALPLSIVTLFTGAFIGIFGFVTGVGMIYKGKDLTESWVSADKLNEDIFVLPAVILGVSGLLSAIFHGAIVNEPKYYEKKKEIVNELKDKDPEFAKMYTRSSELVGRKALNNDEKKELKSLVKNMNRIVKANKRLVLNVISESWVSANESMKDAIDKIAPNPDDQPLADVKDGNGNPVSISSIAKTVKDHYTKGPRPAEEVGSPSRTKEQEEAFYARSREADRLGMERNKNSKN